LNRNGRPIKRLAALGAALVGLLVVVTIATRSGSTHGEATGGMSQELLDYTVSAFTVLFVAAIPLTIYAYALQQRELVALGNGHKRRQIAGAVAVFALLGLMMSDRHDFQALFDRVLGLGSASKRAVHGAPGASRRAPALEPHFRWPVLVVFLLLAAAGLTWWAIDRRRAGARNAAAALENDAIRSELAGEISTSIEDLERQADFGRAVIAAYARMEAVFTRHGVPRARSETSTEYLSRLLLDLTSDAAPVQALTSLYERARFSSHPIDGTMRDTAIRSLRAILDDMNDAL
jgi:hypothetical protein